MIAIFQLVGLRRVPKEGAALFGFLAEEIIDFQLGADVHTAHRVVHEDDHCIGTKRARKQCLLLIAARQRKDVVAQVRCANANFLLPVCSKLLFQFGGEKKTLA